MIGLEDLLNLYSLKLLHNYYYLNKKYNFVFELTKKALHSKPLYSDDSLALHLKNGDEKAFEIIFNQYKAKLYFFALSYLRSSSETEEIIQNVFLSLWEHKQLINETLSIKNYLYKITVNHVYNHLKHEAVRQKFIDYSLVNQLKEDDGLQQNSDFNDLKKTIDDLIERLPAQQQKIFKLSRWDGRSHDEIAKQLGISVRSVENQVYRALQFIRTNLKEEYLVVMIFAFADLFFKI